MKPNLLSYRRGKRATLCSSHLEIIHQTQTFRSTFVGTMTKELKKKTKPFSCSVMSGHRHYLEKINEDRYTSQNKKSWNTQLEKFGVLNTHFLTSPLDLTSVILSVFVRLDFRARLLL